MTSIPESDPHDDPSLILGEGARRNVEWKSRRLCRQVSEALQTGLVGDCADDVLQQLSVVAVEPAPDASRLAVTISISGGIHPVEALAHLERARGRLRSIVAGAISRKKVPDLVFRISGPEEAGR